MRLTRDETFLLRDKFEEFIEHLIGEDVMFKHTPDAFAVECLRPKARVPHAFAQRWDSLRPEVRDNHDC